VTAEPPIMTEAEKAQALLGVVRDVHRSGQTIIGPTWTLYEQLAALALRPDVAEMVRCFLAYRRSAHGVGVQKRLETYGRKTLATESRRFMAIARTT
jgi:hypothetical protein